MDSSPRTFSIKDRLLQNLLLRVRPAALGSLLKKGFRVRRTVIATPAGPFYVDPVSGFGALLTRGSYEPDLVLALWSLLEPGATFVDVGANEGYFSVIASKLVGQDGTVIAVEPQGRLREVLEKNFELNHVRNVRIVDAAISNHRGVGTLHLSPDTNTGSTGLSQSTVYRNARETTATITLTDLLSNNGIAHVDLMKMDIEGFEYEAILGSPELFREQRVRALALELHARALTLRGHAAEEIVAFLKGCGYRMDMRFEHTAVNSVWVAPEG
jgi:FkbM family methyltransferase